MRKPGGDPVTRSVLLTCTALTLIASAPAFAAPQSIDSANVVRPTQARDYSTPGSSMPKPSANTDSGIRFRGPLRPEDSVTPIRTETPLAPSVRETPAAVARTEPASDPAPEPAPAPRTRAVAEPAAPAAAPSPSASQNSSKGRSAQPASVAPFPARTPAAVPERTTRSTSTATKPAETTPADSAVDSEVAAKLRDIVTGRQLERMISRKADREAIVSLYSKSRNFQPLWVGGGSASARAEDAIQHLKSIEADGLDPNDYPLPRLNATGAEAQAEAELKMTETLLTYARHAMNGRVHFSRTSPNVDYKLVFDADDVLKRIASSNDLTRTLAEFNPPQQAYKALRAKLAELRDSPDDADAPDRIPSGQVLKYSRDKRGHETMVSDPRVPLLREKLGLPAENNTNYNAALSMAVGKFQKSRGLQASGLLNGATVDALNGPSRAKRIDSVLATMERWRWMPRDLGRAHVMLNIPDFHIRVYNNGAKVWQTRTVVGKPGHETPLLTETMKYITVNPTWNVPQSIIYNELMPIYEAGDRNVFERQGLKMERDRDGSVRVFQPPGERNALGQIRFNFPNKFLVYQHDTPEKHYFDREKRDYSHGCQRVQDPMKYAEVLLSIATPKAGYTADSIRKMLGSTEKQIDFATHIPVHLTYQTAFVDEAGKLQFREDIYGLDTKLMSILRGSERQVADVAIERPADPNFKPSAEQSAKLRNAAGGGAGGARTPFALFEQLFR